MIGVDVDHLSSFWGFTSYRSSLACSWILWKSCQSTKRLKSSQRHLSCHCSVKLLILPTLNRLVYYCCLVFHRWLVDFHWLCFTGRISSEWSEMRTLNFRSSSARFIKNLGNINHKGNSLLAALQRKMRAFIWRNLTRLWCDLSWTGSASRNLLDTWLNPSSIIETKSDVRMSIHCSIISTPDPIRSISYKRCFHNLNYKLFDYIDTLVVTVSSIIFIEVGVLIPLKSTACPNEWMNEWMNVPGWILLLIYAVSKTELGMPREHQHCITSHCQLNITIKSSELGVIPF